MKVKIYIDIIEVNFSHRAVWLTIIALLKFVVETIKELRMNWRHYIYELDAGDWEQERKEGLRESARRFQKHERLEMAERER